MDLHIRAAGIADCAAVLAFVREHAAFEQAEATITDAELTRLLALRHPPVRVFVATMAGRVIAYAAMTTDYALWRGRRWAHLDCLFVSPEARGLGVGASLLRHVLQVTKSLRIDRLEWQTPNWNARAIAFYRREGAMCLPKMRFSIPLN